MVFLTLWTILYHVLKFSTAAKSCNGLPGLCKLNFDQVTFPGTHNSGSGFDGSIDVWGIGKSGPMDCLYRNQKMSFTEQLEFGIRFFDFDICWHHNEPHLCHKSVGHAGLVTKGLKQISTWMNLPINRNEVIVFRLSDRNNFKKSETIYLMREFLKAFPGPHDGRLALNDYYTTNNKWPKMEEAIDGNKRVFFFIRDNLCDAECRSRFKWALSYNNLVADTYEVRQVVFYCGDVVGETEKKCETYKSYPLIIDSHISTYGRCIVTRSKICDKYLKESAEKCYDKRRKMNKTVNFIIVDYPENAPKTQSVTHIAKEINLKNIQFYKDH